MKKPTKKEMIQHHYKGDLKLDMELWITINGDIYQGKVVERISNNHCTVSVKTVEGDHLYHRWSIQRNENDCWGGDNSVGYSMLQNLTVTSWRKELGEENG